MQGRNRAQTTFGSGVVLLCAWLACGGRAAELPAVPLTWRFATDEADVGRDGKWYGPGCDDSQWAQIKIGQGWEKAGFDYDGIAWYRVRLALPSVPEDKRLLLKFGAVDEEAWVWVNGKFAGEHAQGEGGWQDPFEIDITDCMNPGAPNLIAVRVHDRMLQGGIWKPVTLQLADPKPERVEAPRWPDWARREGFNANYLAWDPDEKNAAKQIAAGCNVVLVKTHLAENVYPDDRANYQVAPRFDGPLGLIRLRRWGAICRKLKAHLAVVLDMFSNAERRFYESKDYVPAVAMDGQPVRAPSVVDPMLWQFFTQQILALATTVPECEGVVIDTEVYVGPSAIYPWYGRNPANVDYSDLCFAPFARQHGIPTDLPPPERYPTLRDRNLLTAYQEHLRDQVRRAGVRLIDVVHAARPSFFVGVLNGDGWFVDGLLAGLATEQCPSVFMSESEYRRPLAGAAGSIEERRADWRTRGANILYCSGLLIADWPPGQFAVEAAERMHRLAGYWIFCGNNLYDRRWRKRKGVWALYPGSEPSDYWRALGEATRRRQMFGPDPAPDRIQWLPQLPGRLDAKRSGRHRVEREAVVVSRTRPSANLLRDPSFEMDWTSRKDTPWRNYYFPKRDDKVVHSGAWAIRVDANRKYANLKQTFPVQPNTAYLLTFWQRKTDLLGDIGYTVAWGKRRQRAAGTSDWTQLRQFVETGPEEREGTVVFGLQSSYGSIWYDDAAVRQVETVHLWSAPVGLPEGKAWLNVAVAARVPLTGRVILDIFDEPGENRLLFPCEVEGELRRDLRGLVCMRPDLRALRLRLTVELGGDASDHVAIERLRVGVTSSR